MERTVTLPRATTDLSLHDAPEWRGALARLAPLWRHLVFVLALFVLLAAWVSIRVDVQALRKDLDRSGRAYRESRVLNDRLRLELDARRRAVAIEAAAARLAVSQPAPVVRVSEP